jgi:hypothetical protein
MNEQSYNQIRDPTKAQVSLKFLSTSVYRTSSANIVWIFFPNVPINLENVDHVLSILFGVAEIKKYFLVFGI